MVPNFHLTYSCYAMARFVEKTFGAVATPCSTGPMTNGNQISVRHAAVAAGLGEFGWMGLVMSPEYGPRNRFGVILTTLELPPDPMYDGEKLCRPDQCGSCTTICPAGAMAIYGEQEPRSFEMGGKTHEYCQFKPLSCLAACYGLRKKFGGKEDLLDTDDPTAEELKAAKEKMPFDEGGLQHYPTWKCGKCLSYCPAGHWNEQYKKTGLSKGIGSFAF
jgi:epoxyqueuosine reductase QueG